MPDTNQDIQLYCGNIKFQADKFEQELSAVVVLKWTPSPRIRFHVPKASFHAMHLHTTIHDYVYSNTNAAGLEAGITLTLTSLDTIAWELLVQQNKMVTEDRFNKLSFADRLRALLDCTKIPYEFAAEFPNLKRLAPRFSYWRDLAGAVADVRNKIVHPQAKDREIVLHGSDAVYEAWQAGLCMLELTLLKLFGLTSGYSDRRQSSGWVGMMAKVPWVI